MKDFHQEITADVVYRCERLEDLPLAPFRISQEVPDAALRLKAVIPFVVRDRKAVAGVLGLERNGIDVGDEDLFFALALKHLEETPQDFLSLDAAFRLPLPRGKQNRAPLERIKAHLGSEDSPALLARLRLAVDGEDGAGRADALFRIFLWFLMATTRPVRQSSSGPIDLLDLGVSLQGGQERNDDLDEESTEPAAARDEGCASLYVPVPERWKDEWEGLSDRLRDIAVSLAGGLDASLLATAEATVRRLVEIREEVARGPRPAVLEARNALASVWDHDRAGQVQATLEDLSDEELTALTANARHLLDAQSDAERSKAELETVEAEIGQAVATRNWSEVNRLTASAQQLTEREDAASRLYEKLEARVATALSSTARAASASERPGVDSPLPDTSAQEISPDPVDGEDEAGPRGLPDDAIPLDAARAQDDAEARSDAADALKEGCGEEVRSDLPLAEPDSPAVDLCNDSGWGEGTDGRLAAEPGPVALATQEPHDEGTAGAADARSLEPIPEAGAVRSLSSLLDRDLVAIAARFASALEETGAGVPIASSTLRVAAASRIVLDGYSTAVSGLAAMSSVAIAHPARDGGDEQRRGALVFGALLRPAVLIPQAQFRDMVKALNLRAYGPALMGLQEVIGDLDYAFAPTLEDLAAAAGQAPINRLAVIRKEILEWRTRAGAKSGPCQPSSAVLNIVATTGKVGRAAEAILAGRLDASSLADGAIEDFHGADLIETQVHAMARGLNRSTKGRFNPASMQFLLRNVGEGVDLLVRWRDVAARGAKRPLGSVDAVARHSTLLKAKTDEALGRLSALNGRGRLDDAITGWLSRRLVEFKGVLEGRDLATSPSILTALSDELDLLPVGCQLTDPTLDALGPARPSDGKDACRQNENTRVMTVVLGDQVMSLATSFEEKLDQGGFIAAERLAARMAPVERQANVDRILSTRDAMLKRLEARADELSRRLKDLNKVDLQSQDQIGRELDRLSGLKERMAEWRETPVQSVNGSTVQGPTDAYEVPTYLDGAEKLIESVRQAIRNNQMARLDQIASDRREAGDQVERLRAQMAKLSLDAIEDRIALIRDGRPIGEIAARRERPLEAFFPGFVEAAAGEAWPENVEDYKAAFEAADGLLALAPERQVAALDLIRAWMRVARQIRSDASKADAVEALLNALTFGSPRIRETSQVMGVRQTFVHDVQMSFLAKDWFCPPEFGSKALRQYLLLAIGPKVLFEQFEAKLDADRPTILLVAERMSVEKRREFAQKLRRRRVPTLLIDESLVAFIATSSGLRLETLFDCALPFGRVEPYTTAAGLLPPEMFFGREREVAQILRRDVDGCLVYGGRQLGKSALLAHVEELHHDPGRGLIVRRKGIDAIGKADDTSKVWGVIAQLLNGEIGIVPNGETGAAGVSRHVQDWLRADSSRRILILLDETERFMSWEARHGFPNLIQLKELMENTQRSFKVVFAGLHNVRRMHVVPNSPLAHFGTPICVGPLNATYEDKVSARRLVIEPMRAAGFAFEDDQAAEDILAYVNHYSSLVQAFCKRLLELLHRRGVVPEEGPLWAIPTQVLFQGEGFDEIRRDIREKFQLTLDLDPRYALIANVLGLIRVSAGEEQVLRTGLSPHEIHEEARKHWPANLQTIDDEGFKALLDELFELGVLGRIAITGSSQRRYVLRTRQVAQMLGNDDDLIEAISNLHAKEAEVDYDPTSYRRVYHTATDHREQPMLDRSRSPLADSQISTLLDPVGGCRYVAGLPVLGLRDVPVAVKSLLGSDGRWGEARGVQVVQVSDSRAFRREIDGVLSGGRNGPKKLIFMRPEARELENLISFAGRQGQVSAGDARPVFLLDASDEALRNVAIRHKAIALRPWGDEMLRAYLHDAELSNFDTPALRRHILRKTGGIPKLVADVAKSLTSVSVRAAAETVERSTSRWDAGQVVLVPRFVAALDVIEDTENHGDYRAMAGLLADAGIGSPEDIVPDLMMVGIVVSHDPDAGRLQMSAFGKLLKDNLSIMSTAAAAE